MALQTKTVQTGDYSWKSWSNAYVICLKLTEESVDIAANTSLVSYLFTISNTNNNRFTDNNNTWRISIAGQNISINNFNFNLASDNTTQTIASGRLTVPHNADGTLQMPYNVSIPNIQSWNRYGPPAMSLTGTWALTEIPRAATISCPTGTIGKPVVISIHNADEALTYTISYEFGALSGTVAENIAQSQVQWMLPTAFYTQIPNAKRGSGSLTCKAYKGTALVGESTYTFYADIDEAACLPTLSPVVEDVNPTTTLLTGDPNTIIRYYSDVCIDGGYSAKNSAQITAYKMSHNGKSHTDRVVTVAGAENGQFHFAVTDSRGLTNVLEVTKPVIPYVKLTCNVESSKSDAEGNMPLSVSGNYFAASFGAVENSLTLQYRYKVKGASWPDTEQWHTLEPEITDDGYIAQTIVTGLNYQKAYTFQVRAMDQLAVAEATMYAARATPVFDWGEQDFAIHGDLAVDGTLSLENTPVLTTPLVRTYCWQVSGGVSMSAVAELLAACRENCAFVAVIQGDAAPYMGVAVGFVYNQGKYGAVTLYDYLGGVQSRRLYNGTLLET